MSQAPPKSISCPLCLPPPVCPPLGLNTIAAHGVCLLLKNISWPPVVRRKKSKLLNLAHEDLHRQLPDCLPSLSLSHSPCRPLPHWRSSSCFCFSVECSFCFVPIPFSLHTTFLNSSFKTHLEYRLLQEESGPPSRITLTPSGRVCLL